MVLGAQSCFTSLAADRESAARPQATFRPLPGHRPHPTFTPLLPHRPKTRVGVFPGCPSGRLSRRGRKRSMNTPGSRACAYKSASGLGKWPNQDPIGEKGFQTLQQVSPDEAILQRSIGLVQAMMQGHLMPSDLTAHSSGENLYSFVRNNAINHIDLLGLEDCPCTKAPSLPSNSSACDSYGNEKYPGTQLSLKCFCKCAGDSSWSQQVRGCLACEHDKGTDPLKAHIECYKAAGLGSAPWGTLTKCFVQCGGVPVIIATQ